MQTDRKIIFLFLFIVFSSFVTAQTLPTRYWGEVTIDGDTAPSGTKIEVLIDGSIETSTITPTTGSDSGSYFVDILTQDNKDLVFQVWGITAEDIKYDSDDSGEFIELDLSVNKLANGYSCEYNKACKSGKCCSGVCKTSCTNNGGGGGGGSTGGGTLGGSSSSSSSSSTTTDTPTETTPQQAPLTNPFGDIMFGSDSNNQDSIGTDGSNTDTQVNSANSDKETQSGLEKTTGGVTFDQATGVLSTPLAVGVVIGIGIIAALAYFYFKRN